MKHFFVRFFKKTGILKSINITDKIIINKSTFKIPIIKEIGFNNLFMTEIWMVQVLKQILKIKPGAFIDVGVNIGQTLIKLRSVDEEREYIGFEPNPACVFYTEELIKKNNFLNTVVIPVGISDKNDVLTLNLYSENDLLDSSASIIENFRTQKIFKKLFVPVFSTETIRKLFSNIGIIKVDVEGAELKVVESFKEIISTERPFVLIEILPSYEKSNTFRIESSDKIVSIISDLKYDIYRVIKNPDNSLNDIIKINEIPVHSDLSLCDYIFVPKELSFHFANTNTYN